MAVITAALLLVALIHLLPAIGVLGAARLSAMYGVPVNEPNLQILLRHRALLFGLLAGFLAYAAFNPELHRLALIGGLLSVGGFMVLTAMVGSPNAALQTVFKVDIAALALLRGWCVGSRPHGWCMPRCRGDGGAMATCCGQSANHSHSLDVPQAGSS